MQPEEKELVLKSLEKSEQALLSATSIVEEDPVCAQNRVYYAAFYAVLALAYLNNIKSSKHSELMGWFNKKYIYQEKLFDKEFSKVYTRLFSNRKKYDYDVMAFPDKQSTLKDIEAARLFVEKIKAYILSTL